MSFLYNAWYVAAWASEVKEAPMSRRLLGENVVLFRGASGAVDALADRCPHRFAPLSRGKVCGEAIESAYHGLQFDGGDRCEKNQTGGGHVPAGAKLRSYPLVQKYQMLWIWMGDPARADAGQLPNYVGIVPDAKAGHDNLDNYLHVKANYLLEIDNLMDLSDVNFLRNGTLGNETMRPTQPKVTETADSVRADLWMPNARAPFGELIGQPCDQWQNMVWMSPTSMLLEFGQVAPGAPKAQKPDELAIHIVTPETERTRHYFFGTAGVYGEAEAWKAEAMRQAQIGAFTSEDNPMIEAIDAGMDGVDLWSLDPVLLRGDTAAVKVRRRIEGAIRAERDAAEESVVLLARSP
jgi:phenylpropionate dioxygenase-like ring-hydroxylating dioxygenase large terminal subunit